MRKEYVRVWACLLLAVVVCITLSACASSNAYDSDLPWNTPQSWEGSPMMPGMNGQ